MKRFKDLTPIVKEVLENDIDTRDDDDYLYAKVCDKVHPGILAYRFGFALYNRKTLNLPNYKTVERVRRKLVSIYPELRPTEDVEIARELEEEVYKQFNKEVL